MAVVVVLFPARSGSIQVPTRKGWELEALINPRILNVRVQGLGFRV